MKKLYVAVALATALAGTVVRAASTELASWYGLAHHGRRMANGHRFDRFRLTAAHRTLKFGMMLKVCLAKTGKCVIVEVTDRGPFYGRRSLDLSEAAASVIGLKPYGVGMVTMEEVK